MNDEPKTHMLVYDCCRFLEVFSRQIDFGPLHLYLSALPYVPVHSVLHESYSGISGLEPTVILGQELKWSLRHSRLPVSGLVKASAFSQYGGSVACVSELGELHVFDFDTSMLIGNVMKLRVESMD